MALVLDEHQHYLADGLRLDAFRRALSAVVRPGDVVLDLGAGTGILGFLACDAGASRVYAVDHGPIISLARSLARDNGLADRVTFLRDLSTHASLPEPVDVVVCDQVGYLGIEAGIFQYLLDARRRLAKPEARFVPSRLTFVAAPLECEDRRRRLAFWRTRPAGLDVAAAHGMAINTAYPVQVEPSQLLGPARPLASAPLPPADLAVVRGDATFTCARAGTLDGLCAWFVAELAPGIEMTNGPGDSSRIDRQQVMLPIARPVDVEAGDTVSARLSFLPADRLINWEVSVRRASGAAVARFHHSTFKGMLLADEELSWTNPRCHPIMTPAGQACRTLLELCDGSRALHDIEEALYERHREVTPTRTDATVFVAEVVPHYCTPHVPVPHR